MAIIHPWQEQPAKSISTAIDLLRVDKRSAFLMFDQNVEQLLKAYLKLPNTIIGSTLSYRERQTALGGSFHDVLMAVGKIAGKKLSENDLFHVKYFHDLRNHLYHDGHGLTVESHYCVEYAKLAVHLLKELLDVDLGQELEKVLDEINPPIIMDFPEIESAINQYKLHVDEYIKAFKKITTTGGEARKKVISIFEAPEIKEQAIEIIRRYTAPYFSGVDENNALVQETKLTTDGFGQYKGEMRSLVLETRLKGWFLGLSEDHQNYMLVYLCLELPDIFGLAPRKVLDENDNISIFCTMIGVHLDDEANELENIRDYSNQLRYALVDDLARVYKSLDVLEKCKNI